MSTKKKYTTVDFKLIDGSLFDGDNQVRDFSIDGVNKDSELTKSRQHIDGMVETLKDGNKLERLVVLPHSNQDAHFKYKLVDGHHRLQAYYEAHREKHINYKSIPITVLHGVTESEARDMALQLNHRNQLNMSDEQKIQEAWLAIWRNWDEFESLGGIKISKRLDGVIKKSLASEMKAVIKSMIDERGYLKEELNSVYPYVDTWKSVRRKYASGNSNLDFEEIQEKAKVRLMGKIYNLKESTDWKMLDDETKRQLGSLLAGQYIDNNNDDIDF